jgi:flagellar biosynthesis/type III secretory pathway M-ring protein FliF/YscJ
MENVNQTSKGKCVIYVVAILATFLLMAFLVRQMVRITQPAPVGAERAAARAKENKDIRAAGEQAAKSWGYLDQPATARAQGFVRMPLEEAMKLTVQGYQNAGAFRSNLLSRAEKANAAVSYE